MPMQGRRGSGLRNRHRNGKHSYSRKGKGSSRDSYGKFDNGRRVQPEKIAGRTVG